MKLGHVNTYLIVASMLRFVKLDRKRVLQMESEIVMKMQYSERVY